MAEPKPYARHEERLGIRTIYRTNFYVSALWAWVTAQREKGSTIPEAIDSFKAYFRVEGEDTRHLSRIYYMKCKQLKTALNEENGVTFVHMGDTDLVEQVGTLNASIDELMHFIEDVLAKGKEQE